MPSTICLKKIKTKKENKKKVNLNTNFVTICYKAMTPCRTTCIIKGNQLKKKITTITMIATIKKNKTTKTIKLQNLCNKKN